MSNDQVNYDMRPVKFYLYRDSIIRRNTRNGMAFRKRHLHQASIFSYLFSAKSMFTSAPITDFSGEILLAW